MDHLEIALDGPETKKPYQQIIVDDSLSEFERARMSSKTWSMEQD